MDLEAESAIQVDTAVSLDIAQSCNKLLETQKKMEAIDEQLKTLKATETTLSEQTIPNLMHKAGVSLIKLKDGSAVEVKPFYAARIPLSKVEEAFTWLRDNALGDIIKRDITVTFGMGEDNKASEYANLAQGKGYEPVQKIGVHPSTLRAVVGERLEAGREMPSDLFKTYAGNRTKITRR